MPIQDGASARRFSQCVTNPCRPRLSFCEFAAVETPFRRSCGEIELIGFSPCAMSDDARSYTFVTSKIGAYARGC